MNLLCKVFGHVGPMQKRRGWWSPGQQYAQVVMPPYIDGIGRKHCQVVTDCERCEETIMVCRIHLPKENDDE